MTDYLDYTKEKCDGVKAGNEAEPQQGRKWTDCIPGCPSKARGLDNERHEARLS